MNDQTSSPGSHGDIPPVSGIVRPEMSEVDRAIGALQPEFVQRVEQRIADSGEPDPAIFKAAILGCEGDEMLADLLVDLNRATQAFNQPGMDSEALGGQINTLTNRIVARRWELQQARESGKPKE